MKATYNRNLLKRHDKITLAKDEKTISNNNSTIQTLHTFL